MHPSKINITIAFEHANVLEIQDIGCLKTDKSPPFWAPFDAQSALKKVKKLQDPLECVTASNFSLKIIYTCSFAAFVGYYWRNRQFWPFWTPIWCPGCPKKGQNLWFVLNEWQYSISGEKLFIYANLQLLEVTFRKMGNFWPFLTPRVPQNGSKLICPKWATA